MTHLLRCAKETFVRQFVMCPARWPKLIKGANDDGFDVLLFLQTFPGGRSSRPSHRIRRPRWFEKLLKELSDKFGGATSLVRAPGHGLWQSGGGTERDTIAVIEVMTEGLLIDYWRALRERL
jgi:hypothetical protein